MITELNGLGEFIFIYIFWHMNCSMAKHRKIL